MPQMKPLMWFIIMPCSVILLFLFFFFYFFSLKMLDLNFNYISDKHGIIWMW